MVQRRSRVSLGPKSRCCLPFSFSLTSLFLPTSIPTLQVLFPLVAISSFRSFPTLSLLPHHGEAHASGCMHLGHGHCVCVCLCVWHVWNMLLWPACGCVTCMSVSRAGQQLCVCVLCVCVDCLHKCIVTHGLSPTLEVVAPGGPVPRLHSSPPSSPEHHPFPMPGLHHERSGKNSHERSGKNSFQKPFCLPSPTSRRLSPQMIPKCPFLHLKSLRQGTSEASPRQVTIL